MNKYVGKICPYCKTEIKEGDEVKVCPECGIPHHAACWEENKGCTTFGCKEQHYEEQHTNPMDVCQNCGAPLGDEQEFCPKCGTPKNAPKKNVCGKCGAELQEGQEFCPKCGQKVGLAVDAGVNSAISKFNANVEKQTKKSKKLPIVIAVALALCIGAVMIISNIVGEKNTAEAIAQYKASAADFYSSVLSDAALLEDIGNDEVGNWHDYIYDDAFSSIESAVLMAQLDHSDDISTVEANYDSITAAYKELLTLPEGATSELEEIKDAVKGAYNAYVDFYETVTDVTGNYNSFSEAFHDTDNAMSSAIKKLGNLVS